jgi:membrane associated rhomboid family serine protease
MNGDRDWGGPSDEHQPVTYWRGYPIFASHLIVIVYCALMIVTAIAGNQIASLLAWLDFRSNLVLSGQVWRLGTYGLFNYPSLSFAFDMLIIVWCGRELERSFGRRNFFLLYGGIYLVAPVVLTLVGLVRPNAFSGQPGALALFVGFATHYPGMPVFFTLLAKWAAFILVGIFTLMALAARNWTALILLWSTCGYAHLFVRHQQGRFSLPSFKLFRRQPKLRVLPDLPEKKVVTPAKSAREEATMAEVDALLDKIAVSGISSLTPKERAKLEAAREGLMKRGAGPG